MDGSVHRGRRVGAIVLGLLAIAAGALWLLFWLFGLAWVWPPGLGIAVFLGVCFALGIAALLVGLNLFPAASTLGSRPRLRAGCTSPMRSCGRTRARG